MSIPSPTLAAARVERELKKVADKWAALVARGLRPADLAQATAFVRQVTARLDDIES